MSGITAVAAEIPGAAGDCHFGLAVCGHMLIAHVECKRSIAEQHHRPSFITTTAVAGQKLELVLMVPSSADRAACGS